MSSRVTSLPNFPGKRSFFLYSYQKGFFRNLGQPSTPRKTHDWDFVREVRDGDSADIAVEEPVYYSGVLFLENNVYNHDFVMLVVTVTCVACTPRF